MDINKITGSPDDDDDGGAASVVFSRPKIASKLEF
jgi:hypothetical protein